MDKKMDNLSRKSMKDNSSKTRIKHKCSLIRCPWTQNVFFWSWCVIKKIKKSRYLI